MLTHLLDASAALELYVPRNPKTAKLAQYLKAQGRGFYRHAILLIPSFCIVEVFNTLAKKCFNEKVQTRTGTKSV
jgi:predicted nucleic acid-binding protein